MKTDAKSVANTVLVISSLINLKEIFIEELEERLDDPSIDPTMRAAYMSMVTMTNCDLEHLHQMKHCLMPRRATPFRLRFPEWFNRAL